MKILKSIPFSIQYPVTHTENELSFRCKNIQVEGFAKLIDHDNKENTAPVIVGDVDQAWCGQEDLKPTIELLGGMDKIQEHANDHAKTLFI